MLQLQPLLSVPVLFLAATRGQYFQEKQDALQQEREETKEREEERQNGDQVDLEEGGQSDEGGGGDRQPENAMGAKGKAEGGNPEEQTLRCTTSHSHA